MNTPVHLLRITALALVACGIVLSGIMLAAPIAAAHASVVATTPVNGALVDRPIDTVVVEFDEVVDPRRVTLVHESGRRTGVGVAAADRLVVPVDTSAGGWFALSWRVVSADGHPVNGAITFRVGAGAETAPASLTGDIASGDAGPADATRTVGRVLATLGVFVAVGSAFVRRFALDRPLEPVRRLGIAGGGLAALGAAITTVATFAGDLVVWPGTVADAAPLAVAAAALAWAPGPDRGRRALLVVVVGLLALSSVALGGHVGADGRAVARIALVAHLFAGALWLGAVPALAVAVHRGPGWQAVGRFSRWAAGGLVAVTLAGGATAWLLSGGLGAVTGTTWGRLLLLKVALVGAAGATGAANRFLLHRPERRWHPERLVVAEAVLLLLVLGATGAMTRHSPSPAVAAAGPASSARTVVLRPGTMAAEVYLTAERSGVREIHLTIVGEDRHPAVVEGASLSFSAPGLGIEPIPQRLVPAGRGHFVGRTDDLRLAGTWTVHLTLREDRFSEVSGEAAFDL